MMNMWKRGLTLILCFLETTILGGALFGWPSLVYVLQADELYIDYCIQRPDTGAFSIINKSLHLTDSNDINVTSSVSFEDNINLRGIVNASSTNMGADLFVTIEADTMINTLEKELSTTGYKDNVGSDIDSNMTSGAKSAIRCKEQKVALSLSYTVATVSFGVSALPIGVFFDHFGLRTTRTITVLLAIIGYCQLAFARRGLEWMILTGAIFIGPTCYTLIITNFHVAKLAGKRCGLAVAIYAAGMNTSFAYQLVKIAHDAGVTRFVALLTLSSLWLVVLFSSWCLLPKFKIEDKDLGVNKHSMFAIFAINLGNLTQTKISPNLGNGQAKEQSLWKYITSATYITFLFWFCADYTRQNMMISGYDTWITEIVSGDLRKVTFYTDFLAYGTLAGSLVTPINGIITDFMFAKYGCTPGGRLLVLLPAAIISSFMMALVNVPLLFHTEAAIYAAVVLFLIAKPLFLSTPAIFMTIVPPMQYYGVVCGIVNVAGGMASFMVYPYLRWAAAAESIMPVTILILVSNILAFSFPFMLYYDRQAEARTKKNMKKQKVITKDNTNKLPEHIPESQQNPTEPQLQTTGV